MTAICIVQARMGSKRLPGKMLLPLNGHTVIGEVLGRCWEIPGIDQVVCAIPDSLDCNDLAVTAMEYSGVYRGSEDDVLSRYYEAANKYSADIVMRVTGDCPLISPQVCGQVLWELIKHDADYASNLDPRTFPKGMDCEVFRKEILDTAQAEASDDEREHVTTWMKRADIKRVNFASPWPVDGRLTLDTEDDYRTICAAFGHEPYECVRANGRGFDPLSIVGGTGTYSQH